VSKKRTYLENEYLTSRCSRSWAESIFDKTAGRDVLYTNHVVKYGLVGIRGAWTSGGIEWNFPDGHTVTAVSSVDFVIRSGLEFAEVVAGGGGDDQARGSGSVHMTHEQQLVDGIKGSDGFMSGATSGAPSSIAVVAVTDRR
jgi:hypothetical protein